jgi:hypothetical protein
MLRISVVVLIFQFATFFASCQDTTVGRAPADLTIRMIDDNRFLMNGVYINFDSCQQRLKLVSQDSVELERALKFRRRLYKSIPWLGLGAFPALGFDLAEESTNGSTPWVNATTICLNIAFFGTIVYLTRVDHGFKRHLKRAIALYNAQIKKST